MKLKTVSVTMYATIYIISCFYLYFFTYAQLCFNWQYDTGKRCLEFVYESSGAMLGVRGLWNLNYRELNTKINMENKAPSNMRWSLGFETYYGVLTKCAGASLGMRLHSGPSHPYAPFILTCTLNPIVGHITSTFSTAEPRTKAFSAQYDFNIYSYESQLKLGIELWRSKQEMSQSTNDPTANSMSSLLKGTCSTSGDVSISWQARIRNFLLTIGTEAQLTKIDPLFFGVHFEYSK